MLLRVVGQCLILSSKMSERVIFLTGPWSKYQWDGNEKSVQNDKLTKLDYARAGIQIEDDFKYMRHSAVIITGGDGVEQKETKVESPQVDLSPLLEAVRGLGTVIQEEIGGLSAKLDTLQEEKPLRALPKKEDSPLEEKDKGELVFPAIPVRSQYDDVSLLGMLLWDEAHSAMKRHNRQHAHVRSDEFMRAMMDKVEKQWREDQKIEDQYIPVPGGTRQFVQSDEGDRHESV